MLYENKMRLVTGPKKTDEVLVVVLSNAVVLLREKEKDGHIAYRLLRDVCAHVLSPRLVPCPRNRRNLIRKAWSGEIHSRSPSTRWWPWTATLARRATVCSWSLATESS